MSQTLISVPRSLPCPLYCLLGTNDGCVIFDRMIEKSWYHMIYLRQCLGSNRPLILHKKDLIRGVMNMIFVFKARPMFIWSVSLDIVSLWSRCRYQLMIVTFARPQVTHGARHVAWVPGTLSWKMTCDQKEKPACYKSIRALS